MPQVESLAKLKAWLLEQKAETYAQMRQLEADHGNSGWGLETQDEETERYQKYLAAGAKLQGRLDAVCEALQKLDQFAIHGFNEERPYGVF